MRDRSALVPAIGSDRQGQQRQGLQDLRRLDVVDVLEHEEVVEVDGQVDVVEVELRLLHEVDLVRARPGSGVQRLDRRVRRQVTQGRDVADVRRDDLTVSFRSMASDIRFWVVDPGPDAGERTERAQQVVERVASTCTRFDPTSDLMRANDAGGRWTVVARECFDALVAAHGVDLALHRVHVGERDKIEIFAPDERRHREVPRAGVQHHPHRRER